VFLTILWFPNSDGKIFSLIFLELFSFYGVSNLLVVSKQQWGNKTPAGWAGKLIATKIPVGASLSWVCLPALPN